VQHADQQAGADVVIDDNSLARPIIVSNSPSTS